MILVETEYVASGSALQSLSVVSSTILFVLLPVVIRLRTSSKPIVKDIEAKLTYIISDSGYVVIPQAPNKVYL